MKTKTLLVITLGGLLLITSLSIILITNPIGNKVHIANPASEYCIYQGGELKIIEDVDGNKVGYCAINFGLCEEWSFYNGECRNFVPKDT